MPISSKMFTSLFVVLVSVVALTASPFKRSSTMMSGQYDCEAAGEYSLCQNLWGESAGVGSQNSTFLGAVGNSVSWTTSWTWANNPNNVKSCMSY